MVAFRRVVVNNVEDDFDTGLVHGFDEVLELLHLLATLPARVLIVRREIAD